MKKFFQRKCIVQFGVRVCVCVQKIFRMKRQDEMLVIKCEKCNRDL